MQEKCTPSFFSAESACDAWSQGSVITLVDWPSRRVYTVCEEQPPYFSLRRAGMRTQGTLLVVSRPSGLHSANLFLLAEDIPYTASCTMSQKRRVIRCGESSY